MSRWIVSRLLPMVVAALCAGTQAAVGAQPRFHVCADGSVGIRNIPAVAVFDIDAREISCSTAYRLIRGFPGTLRSGTRYRGYTCHYRFSSALVAFDYVCVDAGRGYRFAVASE